MNGANLSRRSDIFESSPVFGELEFQDFVGFLPVGVRVHLNPHALALTDFHRRAIVHFLVVFVILDDASPLVQQRIRLGDGRFGILGGTVGVVKIGCRPVVSEPEAISAGGDIGLD